MCYSGHLAFLSALIDWLNRVKCLYQHSIGYLGDTATHRSNQQYQSTEGKNATKVRKTQKKQSTQNTATQERNRYKKHSKSPSLLYTSSMEWPEDGSRRRQGRQAWTVVGLPPQYPLAFCKLQRFGNCVPKHALSQLWRFDTAHSITAFNHEILRLNGHFYIQCATHHVIPKSTNSIMLSSVHAYSANREKMDGL